MLIFDLVSKYFLVLVDAAKSHYIGVVYIKTSIFMKAKYNLFIYFQ